MKHLLNIAFILFFSVGFSQIKSDTLKLESIEDTKKLFSNGDTLLLKNLDTISFKEHVEATLIDSLWLNELIKSPLYDTIQYVLRDDEILITDLKELPTELLKERLADLDSKTPFHIEYNPQLEQIIKTYLKEENHLFLL